MRGLLACLVGVYLLLNLSGCAGPVAKVLADPKKFAVVRDTVFARGLCLNDTVITVRTRDKITYRDTIITRTVRVRTPAICRIDTLVHGTRVLLADGVLTVINKTPCRDVLRTVLRTNTVRDVSREQVYQKLRARDQQALRLTEAELGKVRARAATRLWQLITALLLLAGTGFVAVKKTFLL